MDVHEARGHDTARAVDRLERVAVAAHVADAADRLDQPVHDEEVAHLVELVRRVDDAATAQEDCRGRHRPPPPLAASASSGLPPESR